MFLLVNWDVKQGADYVHIRLKVAGRANFWNCVNFVFNLFVFSPAVLETCWMPARCFPAKSLQIVGATPEIEILIWYFLFPEYLESLYNLDTCMRWSISGIGFEYWIVGGGWLR